MGTQKSTRAGMKWLANLTKKSNNDIIKLGFSDHSYKGKGDWYKRVVAEPSTCLELYCKDESAIYYCNDVRSPTYPHSYPFLYHLK